MFWFVSSNADRFINIDRARKAIAKVAKAHEAAFAAADADNDAVGGDGEGRGRGRRRADDGDGDDAAPGLNMAGGHEELDDGNDDGAHRLYVCCPGSARVQVCKPLWRKPLCMDISSDFDFHAQIWW